MPRAFSYLLYMVILVIFIENSAIAQNLSRSQFDSIAKVIQPDELAKTNLMDTHSSVSKNIKSEIVSLNKANRDDEPIKTPSLLLRYWHQNTLSVLAFDHIPKQDSDGEKITLQQYGPHRASYVMAMVHLAMFEVANLFVPENKRYGSWLATRWQDNFKTAWPAPTINATAVSEAAAIEQAAFAMLRHLYPKTDKVAYMGILNGDDVLFKCDTTCLPAIADGKALGERIAWTIILLRDGDGAARPEVDYAELPAAEQPSPVPANRWQPDPISKLSVALGRYWGNVQPFFLFKPDATEIKHFDQDQYVSAKQVGTHPILLLPPPLAPDTLLIPATVPKASSTAEEEMRSPPQQLRDALDDVRVMGEDPRHRPQSDQKPDENFHYYEGKYWSYDATPSLCAPVRLYNQIADAVLDKNIGHIAPDADGSVKALKVARYYALVNLAMVDAGIEAWKAKYKYVYWRPITGVRRLLAAEQHKAEQEAEEKAELEKAKLKATGVKAPDSTEPLLTKNPVLWYPLGAQNTNAEVGYNITPPFPAYPSGHSVFGSALFEVLRQLVGADTGFEVKSDELNAETQNRDAYNFLRCKEGDTNAVFCKGRIYKSFTEAEACNSASRLWLGVHWGFDALHGAKVGRAIGKEAAKQLEPKDGTQPPPVADAADITVAMCPPPPNFRADNAASLSAQP